MQIIGTWDDHDYGLNDAGKEFGFKDVSQQLMLDFFDEPKDSPRCYSTSDGIYFLVVQRVFEIVHKYRERVND